MWDLDSESGSIDHTFADTIPKQVCDECNPLLEQKYDKCDPLGGTGPTTHNGVRGDDPIDKDAECDPPTGTGLSVHSQRHRRGPGPSEHS